MTTHPLAHYNPTIAETIAHELSADASVAVKTEQVTATLALLDEGASVPFIARYRKEVTGGLDDSQLRTLETRLLYLRELFERKEKVLESIESQGKLTDALKQKINEATTKSEVEDLYLPYRPKKVSKSRNAIEAGLEPYADRLLTETIDPNSLLADFKHDNYPDVDSQLNGIMHILIDRWAEHSDLLEQLKQQFNRDALLHSELADESKKDTGAKFKDYFDSSELLNQMASHRLLAVLRGQKEGVLKTHIALEDTVFIADIYHVLNLNAITPERRKEVLHDAAYLLWKGKWRPHLETALLGEKKQEAEQAAITVFAENLKHLLLAAPAGRKVTMGVDPGIRTGVKLAITSREGDVVDTATIYPFAPKNDTDGALHTLKQLCDKHQVELIAIGNGTASRETDKLIADLQKQHTHINAIRVTVSEAGASVYSASQLASDELPDLDVSLRGAVSIARRLQDPLAELVKIDPKSIGVGQYQHDVSQTGLARMLDAVVEDCVNAVGVDVNTGSPAILARVAGLNKSIAQQIVDYRRSVGGFKNREELKKVPRLGQKTFEQSAGFLRIMDGENQLDASAVHPESYALVENIMAYYHLELKTILGQENALKHIDPQLFITEKVGLPTLVDVMKELEKPGRDPRPHFEYAKFNDAIHDMKDLKPNMILEGVVTNVTHFGAFVDIGVHQDGLVHISALSDQFVSDPQKIVKPGQIVKVRVLEVDAQRKRISLSMQLTAKSTDAKAPTREAANIHQKPHKPNTKPTHKHSQNTPSASPKNSTGTLGQLLMQAGLKRD